MKPTGSEITTKQRAPVTAIGMLLGAHGLAMPDLSKQATPEQAARIKTSLPGFNGQRLVSVDDRDATADLVAWLSKPAPRNWLLGRIATLLSHYFVASTDNRIVEAMADDWAAIIGKHPAWAVSDACRWWIGADNPRHKFKPLPGEIDDRCRAEMMQVRVARMMVECYRQPEPAEQPRDVPHVDMEARRRAAEEILNSVWRK